MSFFNTPLALSGWHIVSRRLASSFLERFKLQDGHNLQADAIREAIAVVCSLLKDANTKARLWDKLTCRLIIYISGSHYNYSTLRTANFIASSVLPSSSFCSIMRLKAEMMVHIGVKSSFVSHRSAGRMQSKGYAIILQLHPSNFGEPPNIEHGQNTITLPQNLQSKI